MKFQIVVEQGERRLRILAENESEKRFLGVLQPVQDDCSPIYHAEARPHFEGHPSHREVDVMTIVFTDRKEGTGQV